MNIIVTYKSQYGSSQQYALWIAEALSCTIKKISDIDAKQLQDYDTIIHVGGLYAGGVNGFKILKKHMGILRQKNILLCMVGMTDPNDQKAYDQVYEKNVPADCRDRIKPFALQGDQLFSKMSLVHRVMMKVPKAQVKKIPAAERTEEHKRFLESFGQDICYSKKEYIKDIIDYIQK